MDISDIITLTFLVGGVGLMLAELALPGLVSIFIGAAAVLTAALRWLGVVEGVPESLLVWMVSSVVMVIALRSTARKWFPADESRGEVDEDLEAFGEVVDVLEDCPELGDDVPAGRIRFDGTTWPAYSTSGVLRAGTQARLVYRKNLNWFIEPANALEAGDESPVERLEESTVAASKKER